MTLAAVITSSVRYGQSAVRISMRCTVHVAFILNCLRLPMTFCRIMAVLREQQPSKGAAMLITRVSCCRLHDDSKSKRTA